MFQTTNQIHVEAILGHGESNDQGCSQHPVGENPDQRWRTSSLLVALGVAAHDWLVVYLPL